LCELVAGDPVTGISSMTTISLEEHEAMLVRLVVVEPRRAARSCMAGRGRE